MEVSGKTALITGGARGIGYELAAVLGAAGARIVICDIDRGSLEEAQLRLKTQGIDAGIAVLDISSQEQWIAVVEDIEARFGPVSFLFNNAGIILPNMFLRDTVEKWRLTIDVNLNGTYYGIRTLLPRMIERGEEAYIVNTASLGGLSTKQGAASYFASKFGVVGLSECLRTELQGTPVHIAVLCPGSVQTGIVANSHSVSGAEEGTLSRMQIGTDTALQQGISPQSLAHTTLAAIRRNDFYILPSGAVGKDEIEARMKELLQAFEAFGA